MMDHKELAALEDATHACLVLENTKISGGLTLKIIGVRPERGIRSRIQMAWAVLHGRPIGQPIIITGCNFVDGGVDIIEVNA